MDNKDLVRRLRGIYRIPITDGLGAVGAGEEPDNPDEFVRRFPSIPIQEEAAAKIEALETLLSGIRWVSVDKDNMEFMACITYSQMDAIRNALGK